MNEHQAPSDHILGLLSQKAVHQAVRLMAASDGSTTFSKITVHCALNALPVLRSLAAEGFISARGSWDIQPTPETTFELTRQGWELVAQLDRLEEWARERRARRPRRT
jgi:DNA-binding HxlR family transcriptional regulator